MATVYGVNKTLIRAGTGGPERADIGQVKFERDRYEATGEAIATVINVCKDLPKDATILDVTLAHDALGASSTISVGDADDIDRYITASDTSSAGVVRLNNIAGAAYLLSASTPLILTTAGGTVTGSIEVTVYYS